MKSESGIPVGRSKLPSISILKPSSGRFTAQPPGYRHPAIWWVSSGRRDGTRLRRLARLLEPSSREHRLDVLHGQTGTTSTPAPRMRR